MTASFATLTLGQAPRSDIMPLLSAYLPAERVRHVGLLDGLDAGQIAERYAPQQGDKLLVSRLLDGTQVTLCAARVESGLQQKIRELEAAGCQVILLLCTGEFGELQAEQALLLEPDRIIPPLISAIVQVLLLMDTVDSRTQRDALRSQQLSNAAQRARLQAERDGLQAIAFPALLQARREEPEVMSLMLLQQQLFTSRRAALQSELAAIAESIAGSQAMLEGIRQSYASKQRQKAMLQEQLSGMRKLAVQGYVARNRLLDLEGQYAQIDGQASEDTGNIGRLGRQILELKLRAIQRREEYQKEVSSQLAEVRMKLDELDNRLAKAEADLGHTQVKAPVAGTVVGLSVFTEGGVIGAGQQLMEIVPSDRGLQVEARIPVELIDKVQVGLPVELLFSAFNQSTTPRVEGEVTLVGADRLTDEKSGAPYYSVRVKVSEAGLQRLNGLEIRPGMPVEGFIRTGERSMMNYLFKPLTDRLHLALTEE